MLIMPSVLLLKYQLVLSKHHVMRFAIKTPHGVNYIYRQIVFTLHKKSVTWYKTYRNDLPEHSPTFWPSTQKVSICSNSSSWLNLNIVIRINLMKWLINYNPENAKINKYLFQKLCRSKKTSGLIRLEILKCANFTKIFEGICIKNTHRK